MSHSPKVDAAELRVLVSTLETLIAEASKVAGELKVAIATAEETAARGVVAAVADRAEAGDDGRAVEKPGGSGQQAPGASSGVRKAAATPWARKRANAGSSERSATSGVPATATAALPPALVTGAAQKSAPPPAATAPVPEVAPSVAAEAIVPAGPAASPRPTESLPIPPSLEIAGAAGGALYGAVAVDSLVGPPPRMAAGPAGPSRGSRRAPKPVETDVAPVTVPGGEESLESTTAERGVALPESLYAAIANLATVSPTRGQRARRDSVSPAVPPAVSPGPLREPAGPARELPGPGGDVPGDPPEIPDIAAPPDMTEPPARTSLPVPRSDEATPELSLLVDGGAPVADIAGQDVAAGPPSADPAPRPAAPLQLVGEPPIPDVVEPPAAEPDPALSSEVLTVLPVVRRDRDSGPVRLARELARRHGLESRGFETADIDTDIVGEIAAALDDLLAKYAVPLYGIEVAEQREDTIRREREQATASGPAGPPQVWITLEQAELTGSGATEAGRPRRRFRRSDSADRPVYAAVVRAFAAALDEAGGYRARQEAWRILMAGSLSGGPNIGGGLLDPRRALVEGFAEFELRGKRAGEPAITLHGALLKMAQAKPEETSA